MQRIQLRYGNEQILKDAEGKNQMGFYKKKRPSRVDWPTWVQGILKSSPSDL
jgi:hypothetical protein